MPLSPTLSWKISWKLPLALGLLSLVPVAAGVLRLLGLGTLTAENARFVAAPVPVLLHIVCAALFCVLGAFQFDAALRQRRPRLHRVAGRWLAACGLLAALSGMWMTATYAIPAPLQGALLYGVRLLVGAAMGLAVVLSVRAALQRRIVQHRAWMLRAYALGQGAGTQVLILLPLDLLAAAPTPFLRDLLMSSAWALNLGLAEWLIRRRLAPL